MIHMMLSCKMKGDVIPDILNAMVPKGLLGLLREFLNKIVDFGEPM